MKDLLIGFIIALVLGSICNDWQHSQNSTSQNNEAAPAANIGSEAPLKSADQSNFQAEVLEQSQPVLVDFYTQNCPHCKKMAPMLSQLALQCSGNLKIVQVDIMENPAISHKYDIGGVPSFILFDHGKVLTSFMGEMPKNKLLDNLRAYISI